MPHMKSLLALSLLLTFSAAPAIGQTRAEFSLDTSRLTPDTASFVFLHEGMKVGETHTVLEVVGDTVTVSERTTFPGGFQETTAVFLPGPRMRYVAQKGEARAIKTAIDVRYGEGRAQGQAVVPTPFEADTITVDLEVPEGVIDDNVLLALFAAMTLAPGMEFSLPVFSAGKNELSKYEFTVSSAEPIEWQGESIETLTVEAHSDDLSLTYIVSEEEPHVVLQILPSGPMTIQRVPADR